MPIPLASLAHDPRAAIYANLKDAQLRSREFLGTHSLFIAESQLVVRSLLASRYPVHSILCTDESLPTIADALPPAPTHRKPRTTAPTTSFTNTASETSTISSNLTP
jgi:hypothetical protein